MTEGTNQDLFIIEAFTSLVERQSKSCIALLSLSNSQFFSPKIDLQNIELQKSACDMLITMNVFITSKLIDLGTEDEEQEFINHSLTVGELDNDYDEELDG